MALSDEDKKDFGDFLDTWLGQAADHIKGALKPPEGTPPPPPKTDPPKTDPPKTDPPKTDPPKGPRPSRSWFGDRAE